MLRDAARTYRQLSAQGTSQADLVVQAYDQIANSLYEAVRAVDAFDIGKKTADLNHALRLIAQLQGILDFEQGGEVARSLDRFYSLERSQILIASARNSIPMIRQIAERFLSMREAWAQIAASTSKPADTAPMKVRLPRGPYEEMSGQSPNQVWNA